MSIESCDWKGSTHWNRIREQSLPGIIFGMIGAVAYIFEFYIADGSDFLSDFTPIRSILMGLSLGVSPIFLILTLNIGEKWKVKLMQWAKNSFYFAWNSASLLLGFFLVASAWELLFGEAMWILFGLFLALVLFAVSYGGYCLAQETLVANADGPFIKIMGCAMILCGVALFLIATIFWSTLKSSGS